MKIALTERAYNMGTGTVSVFEVLVTAVLNDGTELNFREETFATLREITPEKIDKVRLRAKQTQAWLLANEGKTAEWFDEHKHERLSTK